MSVIHTQSTSARIQKDVNKAQRGEFEGQHIVKAVSNLKPMAPPPNIPLAVKIPFPEHLRSRIGGHTGYSSAHELYSSCHQFFHDRAMCAGNTELVTLSATMVYAKGGRFKAVGDVTAIIPHINVRVGYHDLYSVLYIYLLPLWLKYSRNVQLLQSDTVLCNDLHAAMLAKTPDIDVIKDKCYEVKGRNKTKSLIRNKPIKVFLHVDAKFVNEADFRRVQFTEDEAPDIDSVMTYTVTRSATTSTKRRRSTDSFYDSSAGDGPVAIKKSKLTQDSFVVPVTIDNPISIPSPSPSVSRADIRQALIQQTVLRQNSAPVSLKCVVHCLPDFSWSDLIENPTKSQNLRQNFPGIETTVIYDPKQTAHEGSFKMALVHCSTSKIVVGEGTRVCLKRCFDRDVTNGEKLMYCKDKQFEELSRELNCLLWAKIMLRLVYDYIDSANESSGSVPPFSIPKLHFVDAALAVVTAADGREEFYMIEELIPENHGWSFTKYICNNSAVPLLSNNLESQHTAERNHCARFLSFAQHIQYIQTSSLAFTSDFQGANHLLTDPQIITDPLLGTQLFARGNVAFDMLLTTHICSGNEFCEFYKPSRSNFTAPDSA
ncbi:hypothetical protein C8R42DRAFT_682093 [Lentinula raphanica]|nr:hypothetical protein C8R42DRAFT_682093 [Lentinula raphanica]